MSQIPIDCSQNFAPVVQMDDELWSPSIWFGGKRYQQFRVGDPAVNIVYQMFMVSPARVAWIGERSNMNAVRGRYYVEDDLFDQFFQKGAAVPDVAIHNTAFDLNRRRSDEILAARKGMYLLNLDKKRFIKMDQYMNDLQSIDILPFLTLVSAPEVLALDGGSFPFDGSWAFDTIQMYKKVPKGYQEYLPEYPF